MKFQKILGIVLVCISLSGCQPARSRGTVGLCYRDGQKSLYYRQLEQSLRQEGWKVHVRDAHGDQAVQDGQIIDLLQKGCAALLVEPVMVTTTDSVVEQLRQANVPGVFLSYEPPSWVLDSWQKAVFVGCDKAQTGALQSSILMQTPSRGDLNGDGVISYMVLRGPRDSIGAGMQTEKCIASMGLRARCVSLCCCDGRMESGRAACAGALMNQGDSIEAVFCGNDSMARGAFLAIRDSGRQVGKDILLIGSRGDQQMLEMVRRGQMTGTVAEDVDEQIRTVLQVLEALTEGKPAEKRYYIDHVAFTADNA